MKKKESHNIFENSLPLEEEGRYGVRLKVCGMKYNAKEVAELQPDYLGFIFWKPSKRFFEGEIPKLQKGIKKIGVFVDAKIDAVLEKLVTYSLDGIQLHGNESTDYCERLLSICQAKKSRSPKLIKVFSIKDSFNFDALKPYEDVCDYFLFDTKGALPGGNGYAFNWEVLKGYPSTKPYFLSGGIGIEEIESLRKFIKQPESKHCHAIDVNSKFEINPGLKNIAQLKEFKKAMKAD